MKKAKMMLSAIAVIAVIGGALAFKAHKTQQFNYFVCSDPNPALGTCSTLLTQHKGINPNTSGTGNGTINNAILSSNSSDNCNVGGCATTTVNYTITTVE